MQGMYHTWDICILLSKSSQITAQSSQNLLELEPNLLPPSLQMDMIVIRDKIKAYTNSDIHPYHCTMSKM